MKLRVIGLIFFLSISVFVIGNSKEKHLNTAANASYLTTLEKDVVYEINLFRSNPADYAEKYIAPLAKHYSNTLLNYPGETVTIRTHEGLSALKECVRVLEKAKPVSILSPNKALSKAARDHQKDQERTGKTGHTGSDRSDVKERIERYGTWQFTIAENIAYGNSSARQIVIFLLIDDGVRSRGHRKNLLNDNFKTIGIACGEHPKYRTMCVMDFAGGMSAK